MKPLYVKVNGPQLAGTQRLIDAPLNVDDWAQIHAAYRAFMLLVRAVVKVAEEREGQRTPPPPENDEGDAYRPNGTHRQDAKRTAPQS